MALCWVVIPGSVWDHAGLGIKLRLPTCKAGAWFPELGLLPQSTITRPAHDTITGKPPVLSRDYSENIWGVGEEIV